MVIPPICTAIMNHLLLQLGFAKPGIMNGNGRINFYLAKSKDAPKTMQIIINECAKKHKKTDTNVKG